jgi:hypothetical protein
MNNIILSNINPNPILNRTRTLTLFSPIFSYSDSIELLTPSIFPAHRQTDGCSI